MAEKFYIVGESILSEAMKKTVQVKDLLKNGQEKQIKDAVKRIGLSRTAFYKYKDFIFPLDEEENKELITLSLLVVDRPGILSELSTTIAQYGASVLTINQDIPLNEVAHITLTIKVDQISISLDGLLEEMEKVSGIRRLKLIAKSFKSR